MKTPPLRIDAALIESLGPCPEGLDIFKSRHPDGITLTYPATVHFLRHPDFYDVEMLAWLGGRLGAYEVCRYRDNPQAVYRILRTGLYRHLHCPDGTLLPKSEVGYLPLVYNPMTYHYELDESRGRGPSLHYSPRNLVVRRPHESYSAFLSRARSAVDELLRKERAVTRGR